MKQFCSPFAVQLASRKHLQFQLIACEQGSCCALSEQSGFIFACGSETQACFLSQKA